MLLLRSRDTRQQLQQLQQYALNQMQLRTQNESLQSQLEQAHSLNTAQNERLLEASREATSAKSQLAAQAQYHQQQVQQYQLQQQQQLIEFTTQKKQLNQEFEHIAQKIFSANSQHFSQNQEQSVKLLLAPFRDQLHNFSQQVEHFKQNQTASNASLNTELQHLKALNQQITQEAHTLSRALKGDKKLSGTWGEMQLERSLQAAGLQADCHYLREANYSNVQGQNRRPDFIVKLPDGKDIIIDSKISLVDFNKAIAADTQEEQTQALTQHVKALKKHIDELAQKDYSALIGMRSPHFVLMYIAIEPAYIEALKHDIDVFDYGSQKNIILVSHTTLMPLLKTIANLWLLDRSHSQAFEIAEKAGDIYQQVCLVAERLHKLGRSLQTATGHYNDTVTSMAGRQGLYGKVERFSEVAKQGQAPSELPPLAMDIDSHRLEPIMEPTPNE
ncbi:MAG: DNA recombination protein RmuC [Marinagarivorans sp.]|nr:DNA recombination protein RmuC [Marinagarivorans sp.]